MGEQDTNCFFFFSHKQQDEMQSLAAIWHIHLEHSQNSMRSSPALQKSKRLSPISNSIMQKANELTAEIVNE